MLQIQGAEAKSPSTIMTRMKKMDGPLETLLLQGLMGTEFAQDDQHHRMTFTKKDGINIEFANKKRIFFRTREKGNRIDVAMTSKAKPITWTSSPTDLSKLFTLAEKTAQAK